MPIKEKTEGVSKEKEDHGQTAGIPKQYPGQENTFGEDSSTEAVYEDETTGELEGPTRSGENSRTDAKGHWCPRRMGAPVLRRDFVT